MITLIQNEDFFLKIVLKKNGFWVVAGTSEKNTLETKVSSEKIRSLRDWLCGVDIG